MIILATVFIILAYIALALACVGFVVLMVSVATFVRSSTGGALLSAGFFLWGFWVALICGLFSWGFFTLNDVTMQDICEDNPHKNACLEYFIENSQATVEPLDPLLEFSSDSL